MYTPPPDLRAKASATAQGGSTHEHHHRQPSTSPPPNTNKQQKQTAKEVIAANVQALIEQLEQGHSEALTAYLTAMGRFHNYSFGNILEIARQKPDATRVAGLYAWNQLGRKVKKGERGIRILAPVIGIRRKKDEEAEKDIRTQNQAVLVGFRAAYVFDVSQTEGEELPEFSERVSGSAGEYRDRLVDFVIAQGIALEFKESIAPALGMSYGGKIALLPGQSSAEEFSTLVHELAHEMLHKAERRTATTKTVRETEAEAVAFVVGKTIGLENGQGIGGLHPPVPRQRGTAHRELGSDPEDLRPHSRRNRKPRSRDSRRAGAGTGASQLTRDFDDADGPAPSAQLPRTPNRSKESNP